MALHVHEDPNRALWNTQTAEDLHQPRLTFQHLFNIVIAS